MSTHKLCFGAKITKIIPNYHLNYRLSWNYAILPRYFTNDMPAPISQIFVVDTASGVLKIGLFLQELNLH